MLNVVFTGCIMLPDSGVVQILLSLSTIITLVSIYQCVCVCINVNRWRYRGQYVQQKYNLDFYNFSPIQPKELRGNNKLYRFNNVFFIKAFVCAYFCTMS